MSSENLEEEGLPKNPKLNLAQWKFMLTTEKYKNDRPTKDKLKDAIIADNMTPFYEEVCTELGWRRDENLVREMKKSNDEDNQKLDAGVKEAEKSMGETEVRDAMLKKAEYLCSIGDKAGALAQFRLTQEKIVTLGYKLDLVFHLIRIGLFYNDHDLITRNLEKAQSLIDEGGDWDRRNRLKVYRGLYSMSVRDFSTAARLFLDTVATFTSYELMDYSTFVAYTVLCSMIALDRTQLREEVVKGAEIQESLHGQPIIRTFLYSLYDCQYSSFFRSLAEIEELVMCDRYLHKHTRFYVRELRIKAYSQLLESYRSLTLQYMADAFGVTMDFIDLELSRFIAANRLHCKIDKVGGIVETNRPDSKNHQYQSVIKSGDILLNRIQKLSRIINI